MINGQMGKRGPLGICIGGDSWDQFEGGSS